MTRLKPFSSTHAGLVNLPAAGNAAVLRMRQSTNAHTRRASRNQNRVRNRSYSIWSTTRTGQG